MCEKIEFETRVDAKNYIKEVSTGRLNRKPNKMKAYDCEQCDFWHITQQKKLKHHKLKHAT